ncbi:MAG: ATP-binding protein [Desulfobulbaceae bacterium]|nr:ATP-binding protein [Desulfobulbaceae bacterium]
MLDYINPRNSISARIGISITCLALFLSLASSLFLGIVAQKNAEESIGETLEDLAYQMADKLDRGMFERYREIQIMAQWPEITDPVAAASAKRAILQKMKETYPVHSWIGLTDVDGNVIAGTDGLLEGKNAATRPWFPGAQKGPYVGDVHGALLLAKHLPAPPDGNLRFVDVASPVRDAQGRFIGVLCSHLNWEWAGEIKESLLFEDEREFDVELAVLNNNGEMLLGPSFLRENSLTSLYEKVVARSGDHQHSVQTWPDGVVCLTGYAKCGGYRDYPGLGWTVVAWQPVAKAFAPARKLMFTLLVYGSLSGLLLAVLGWSVVHRLSVPISNIARVADQIRQGNHDIAIKVLPGRDEVATLSSSLSEMLATLNRQNLDLTAARDQLEEKVKKRTRDLEIANAELHGEIFVRQETEAKLRKKEIHLNEAQKIGLVGSMEVDPQENIYWSEQFFRLLGYEPGQVEPSLALLLNHIHGDQRQTFSAFISRADGEEDLEAQVITSDGVTRHCLLRASTVGNETEAAGPGKQLTMVDISERKAAEKLRDEVDRIMRHDLKTPLNAIIGYPQLMATADNLTEAQKGYLSMITEAGYRMLQQINESLTIYKIESGNYQIDLKPVDLVRLINRIRQELYSLADSFRVEVELTRGNRPATKDDAVMAAGEELLLFSMFSNLIKNAIEASPQGAVVTINIAESDGGIGITIHNQGVVAAEVREGFFEKFSSYGKTDGTGLGTYSAKLLAEAHHGQISFTSSEEKGTMLYVNLPTARGAGLA